MEHYLDAYVTGWGVPEQDHAQFKANVRPWREQPGWSLYLARVDGRSAAAAILYVADRVAYLADGTTAPCVPRPRPPRRTAAAAHSRCQHGRRRLRIQRRRAEGTSHRNMERAGLRLHFLRTKWTAA